MPFFEILRGANRTETASAEPSADETAANFCVQIVGNPNVGKSVLFNRLTGRYVTVSNYPGTTVEVSRGRLRLGDTVVEVIDTPGMYSLMPLSEEERVARTLLMSERADLLLHVVDAKNLERMLVFTLQLIEAGLPVVLVVNMLDEAERAGITIDLHRLSRALETPVVGTAALTGRGIDELKSCLEQNLGNRRNSPVHL